MSARKLGNPSICFQTFKSLFHFLIWRPLLLHIICDLMNLFIYVFIYLFVVVNCVMFHVKGFKVKVIMNAVM